MKLVNKNGEEMKFLFSERIIKTVNKDKMVLYAYEHPLFVRLTHWLNTVSLIILVMSGLEIFSAFPSFGEKIPQTDLVSIPNVVRMGGWLGGAIQWHFTFMWIFIITGLAYIFLCFLTGYWKNVFFLPKDIKDLLPMIKHYFFFKPKPQQTQPYNALQKLAYTLVIVLGVFAIVTGILLYKPVQFSFIVYLFGGFKLVRFWHFTSMCGFLLFIVGHIVMVILHGWNNFLSILVGWKQNPDYINLPDK